jgi:hypothetical protein
MNSWIVSCNVQKPELHYFTTFYKHYQDNFSERAFVGRQTIKNGQETGYVLKIVSNALILAVIFQVGLSIPRS